jgi:excisionase family DNA binding protein
MTTALEIASVRSYLTYSEAEQLFGLNRSAIRAMAHAGKIRLHRPLPGGRKVLVSRQELESVIERSASQPGG